MYAINRRVALAGLALSIGFPVRAATPEQLTVEAEGRIALTRFAADRAGRRASVLLLHGAGGFERKPLAYERYANALAAKGFDAYFLNYFTTADASALQSKTSTREGREATILARADSSGRIGLLGLSLGGYVAAETAARDERVAALAVLYGGMPDAMIAEVKHLPPLIELHGEADRNVPVVKGQELVKLGNAIGAEAEFVPYPNRQHGFDFSDTDPMTADAVGRIINFFETRLSIT